MRDKARNFIWSTSLVAGLAIVGALTLFGVLGLPNAEAQDGGFAENPAAPTIASPVPGNGTIIVSWTMPPPADLGTPTYNGFSVQYHEVTSGADAPAPGSTGWTEAPGTSVLTRGDLSHQITGLDNNKFYFVRVALALQGGGMPASSTYGVSTIADPVETVPGKVTDIHLKQTGNAVKNDAGTPNDTTDDFDEYAVTVSWTPPANNGGAEIIGYVVQVSGATSTDFTDFGSTATDELTENTDQFSKSTSESVKLRKGGVVRIISVNSATTSTAGGDGANLGQDDLNAANIAASSQTSSTFDPVAAISLSTIAFGGNVSDIDSTSGSGGVNITIKVESLKADVPIGSSIVLYLEDDYQVPSSIPASSIIFHGTGTNPADGYNTGAVSASISPTIKTDAYIDADKKDYAIRIRVPDFCSGDNTCGLLAGQDLTVVVTSNSDIKNPTEAGSHSNYVDVLGPVDELKSASTIRNLVNKDNDFPTVRKIGLSSVDGGRGDELTVSGSGFKDGLSAAVYVLSLPDGMASTKWNALDCAQMIRAGTGVVTNTCDTTSPWAKTYANLGVAEKAQVDGKDFFTDGPGEAAFCSAIVFDGTRVGDGDVGSDDKVDISFEVSVPTFRPGPHNYICMGDGTGHEATTDVEDFKLTPSIRVSPSTANVGDTVTLFAQDFPPNDADAAAEPILLANRQIAVTSGNIGRDGSGTTTFPVPGWAEGTLKLEAWGEDTKLTVIGSALTISKPEALPNELLTLTGSGFGTGSNNNIPVANITVDGVSLIVPEDSQNSADEVEVSSSGQFVTQVILWPAGSGTNPTLIAGNRTIRVEASNGFVGKVAINIPEATIKVTPEVAGPRDVVNISGENWPVENLDGGNLDAVEIDVIDGSRTRQYSVYPDGAGRFFQEHQVHSGVTIPSTSRVEAKYGDVVKLATYQVPEALIEVTPGEGQPGATISLMVDKMPVHSRVSSVKIAGRDVLPVGNFSTDATGSVTVDGVIIPGIDPGVYSVQLQVRDTVAIGSVEVLAEVVGTDTPVGEALDELGDTLEAVFYFDNITKSWDFYDPRPDFADLNTLTDLVDGETYWVLVSEDVEDVVLNNRSRDLTCSGGNCWNLVRW